MAGTALGAVPVFMRIGDGEEYEVGSITPEVGDLEYGADGSPYVMVSAPGSSLLPGLLRRVADEMERVNGQ